MYSESHEDFIERWRVYYKTFKPVFCYALQRMVNFNSMGFRHLRYKGSGDIRTVQEQIYKLRLLPFVVPVIKVAKTIATYERINLKDERKYMEFWSLQARVGIRKLSVTVILRKIGEGEVSFYSVIKRRS